MSFAVSVRRDGTYLVDSQQRVAMDAKQGVARGNGSDIRPFVLWSSAKGNVSDRSVFEFLVFLRMKKQMRVRSRRARRAHNGTHLPLPLYLWVLSNPNLAFGLIDTDRSRLVDYQYPTMVKAS
jgi:hypothetical protein